MEISRKTKLSEPGASKAAYGADGHLDEVISNVDYAAAVDTKQDRLRELIDSGMSLEEIAFDIEREIEFKVFQESLVKILLLISESPTPALDIDVLICASGLPLKGDLTHSQIADSHGVSKQVFSSRIKAMLKRLGLHHKPRACKTEQAGDSYRLANKRRTKFN